MSGGGVVAQPCESNATTIHLTSAVWILYVVYNLTIVRDFIRRQRQADLCEFVPAWSTQHDSGESSEETQDTKQKNYAKLENF